MGDTQQKLDMMMTIAEKLGDHIYYNSSWGEHKITVAVNPIHVETFHSD